ncbi:tRNA pseudouridine(55) synthase TruB [Aquibacillus albus]|uniref:tRNA pseudouridine synthase B n=1 Tax=Aquibacillus albus TaxID=1168171 RepID=A0ABS2N1R4_9BACI|nr:tRNA pseudouridine(55) synthase TruB [Aquibacillus albus]MBM7572068.1 tRNA pseudouridine55 synthase [Aquibacillus albus]
MEGIVPLWKPKGMTSHDCVVKIRKLFQTKKVGHTGTLDPEVEGVLPICVGQATKIVPFLTDTKKTYVAEMTLGYSTETEDSHGQIVEKKEVSQPLEEMEIISVLQQFQGKITQVPPMYSAVKVNGKKLYEYAREGKIIDRPERMVYIDNITLLSINSDQTEAPRISFKVTCSKGTYIRTLCVDIGRALGFPAHMSQLIRTKTGSFEQKDCFTFEQIDNAINNGLADRVLAPLKKGVAHLDTYYIDTLDKYKVSNGQKLPLPDNLPKTNPFLVQYKEELMAIYQIHPANKNEIKPVRVFARNEGR